MINNKQGLYIPTDIKIQTFIYSQKKLERIVSMGLAPTKVTGINLATIYLT